MILSKLLIKTEYFEGLNALQHQSLVLLYPSLLSSLALTLYLTLVQMSQDGFVLSYQDLSQLIGSDVLELENARIELEQFELCETYEYQAMHQLILKAPLTISALMNHMIYGRLLTQKLDETILKQLTLQLDLQQKTKPQGRNISASFDSALLAKYDEAQEAIYQDILSKPASTEFNMKGLLDQLTDTQLPMSQRTQANLNLIESYGAKYKLSLLEMKKLIARAVDQQRFFNPEVFRSIMDRQLVVVSQNVNNPYELTSEQFLQLKQPNLPIANSDLNLIQLMRDTYKFKDDLINVLIDYVIGKTKGGLPKNYLESIGSAWVRGNIKTSQDALAHLRSLKTEQKTSKPSKKIVLDEGYQPEVISDQTMEEIKAALKEFYPDDENL